MGVRRTLSAVNKKIADFEWFKFQPIGIDYFGQVFNVFFMLIPKIYINISFDRLYQGSAELDRIGFIFGSIRSGQFDQVFSSLSADPWII
jgi:hypothetical protein